MLIIANKIITCFSQKAQRNDGAVQSVTNTFFRFVKEHRYLQCVGNERAVSLSIRRRRWSFLYLTQLLVRPQLLRLPHFRGPPVLTTSNPGDLTEFILCARTTFTCAVRHLSLCSVVSVLWCLNIRRTFHLCYDSQCGNHFLPRKFSSFSCFFWSYIRLRDMYLVYFDSVLL